MQRETVTAIENGRSVSCYYDADAEAALERGLFTRFLRVWLGDDFFLPVIKVEVDGGSVTDAVLKRLAELRDVRLVTVNGPEAPKGVLEYVEGLPRIEELALYETNIGDLELRHLAGLKQLTYLNLEGTRITDAGLEHLRRLTRLRQLSLGRTTVTDAGLEYTYEDYRNLRS